MVIIRMVVLHNTIANAVMMQLEPEEDGVEPPKEESADDTQA